MIDIGLRDIWNHRAQNRPSHPSRVCGLKSIDGETEEMIDLSVIRADYSVSFNEPIITVFCRDVEKNLIPVKVKGFKPYCYVPVFEVDQICNCGGRIDTTETHLAIDGVAVYKVEFRVPSGVRKLRDRGITVYEGDVPYPNRFLIDRGITRGIRVPLKAVMRGQPIDYHEVEPITLDIDPRTCIIDIECDTTRGFPKANRDQIIAMTAWDSYTNHYTSFSWDSGVPSEDWRGIEAPEYSSQKNHRVILYPSESSMLRGIIQYLDTTDPDIISGWNVQDFDIPYIEERLNQLGFEDNALSRIKYVNDDRIRGRSVFDLLVAYKRFQAKAQDSYKLGAVAEHELGRDKVTLPESMDVLFKTDKKTLLYYNLVDVELCVEIDAKNKIIEFYYELSRYVGTTIDRATYPANLIDNYILRKSKGRFVLPTKQKNRGDHQSFQGAQVFSAVTGVYSNVVVFDLKSLYPMSMLTVNASFETKDPNGEFMAPSGTRFKKHPIGLMRDIIGGLLEERKKLKDERDTYPHGSDEWGILDKQQSAVKIVMNAYYGVSGYPGFRLYDPDIAAAITSIGREVIRHTRTHIESAGYRVLYGDTDSCMVEIPGDTVGEVIAKAGRLETSLNESYDGFAKDKLNADEHFFSIRFEKIYRKFFQPGVRKRYAGHLVWEEGKEVDIVDIVGFEQKRSDSALITRKLQEKVFDIIFSTGDIEAAREYIRVTVKKFRSRGYSLDCIGIPGGFSRPLEDYVIKDAHVRGAMYANSYLKSNFRAGDKAKRVYIQTVTEKYPRTDVICFEDGTTIPPEFVIDTERMLNMTIRNPLMRILVSLGLTWEQVDPSYTTLFDFGVTDFKSVNEEHM